MSTIQIYTDGGARGNPGPAAIGVLILSSEGRVLKEHGDVIGETTNNVAEYTAMIKALEFAKELGAEEIVAYTDSQLVAYQLIGKYKIKTPHIKDLFLKVKERQVGFQSVTFNHVPRTNEHIKKADQLVNDALDRAGF